MASPYPRAPTLWGGGCCCVARVGRPNRGGSSRVAARSLAVRCPATLSIGVLSREELACTTGCGQRWTTSRARRGPLTSWSVLVPDTPDQPTPRIKPNHHRELAIVDNRDVALDSDETVPAVERTRSELGVLLAHGGLSPVSSTGSCSSYWAGHETHYIMARKFHRYGRPGTVVGSTGMLSSCARRAGRPSGGGTTSPCGCAPRSPPAGGG